MLIQNPRDPNNEGLLADLAGHSFYCDGTCANCEDPKCQGCFGRELTRGAPWHWRWFAVGVFGFGLVIVWAYWLGRILAQG